MSSTIYLNIGSNQGDRRAHIEQAVALIAGAYPAARLRLSAYFESEPWGYASEHKYLNLGVAIDLDTESEPHDVLQRMLGIQRSISDAPHRAAGGGYCDRAIDIDIISVDKMSVCDDDLQLPHPRARQRAFVMEPLKELATADVVDFVRRAHAAPKIKSR